MEKLNSYAVIQNISNDLRSHFDNDDAALKIMEENVDKVSEALSDDFFALFGEKVRLVDTVIFYNDETYRQSATAYFIKFAFLNDDNFKVAFECLVDFNKIYLKVKSQPDNKQFEVIAHKIESAYNFEGKAEIRNLSL